MIRIDKLINHPISSNCFIIWEENDAFGNECILIDPGSKQPDILMEFLTERNLIPHYIFITHEHFDHIWGVNYLRERYPNVLLVSHEYASLNIGNSKKNLSLFYDGVGFEVRGADILVSEFKSILWNQHLIELLATPGHSQGGMCIRIGEYLFVGDLILKDVAPVVKLPGANIHLLKQSVDLIKSKYNEENLVLKCGHGEDMTIKDLIYD